MKILITGGSGFVGHNLIDYFIKKYPSYRIINLDRQSLDLNKKQYFFVEADVRNQELIEKTIKEYKIQMVINLTHDDSETGIQKVESNVCGQYVLLETAQKYHLERFIYLSSDNVYPTNPLNANQPVLETDLTLAQNLESAYKISAESLSLAFYHLYQTPVVILRSADCLGPWMNPKNLAALFIINALKNHPLPVYNEGTIQKEWLDIDDLCLAIDKVLHSKNLEGEIFNLGWSMVHSIIDLAKQILTRLDKPENLIRFIDEKQRSVSKAALDTSKAKSTLGWEPKTSFNESLGKTIKWFQKNTHWWEKENIE